MKILDNGVAVIEGDTHHAVWCQTEGLVHDLFAAGVLRRLIAKYNVSVCVDAGANIGTLTAAMLNAGCHVHAFEPNRDAVECLRHNCPEAHIYACGLSSGYKKAALVKQENAGASYVEPSHPGADDSECVQLAPLDHFDIKAGLIKIDCEGYETYVLRGAAETIQEYRPVIVAEVNQEALTRAGSSKEALGAILSGFGYSWEIMQPDCRWPDPQFDIIATPDKL